MTTASSHHHPSNADVKWFLSQPHHHQANLRYFIIPSICPQANERTEIKVHLCTRFNRAPPTNVKIITKCHHPSCTHETLAMYWMLSYVRNIMHNSQSKIYDFKTIFMHFYERMNYWSNSTEFLVMQNAKLIKHFLH